MAEFLNKPWGMAVFVIVDIAVLLLIISLNYRWLFKRTLDFLFSIVFLAVLFPFFLVVLVIDAIYNKATNAWRSLFTKEMYCGKKGKPFTAIVFTTERILRDEEGNLLPEDSRTTPFGRFLKNSGMKYYPMLLSVLIGKMSFVGPRPLTLTDSVAIGEDGAVRFSVRPGLASSLDRYGGENLTYAEMFEEDEEYVSHIKLFSDISFFVTKIVNKLRGERINKYGEAAQKSYVQALLDAGEITEEEAKEFEKEGQDRTNARLNEKKERRDFEQRNFFR